ncbi:hypothetical protein HYS85_01130 [Candidatus Saccharibacteria bacterium]|nr:hypothetical protein [Candidatus Saccharibacteria bacterium]
MDTEHKGPFYSSKYPDLRFLSQAALNIIRAASFDELLSEKLRRKEEIHKNIHRHIGRLALEAAGIEFSTK